ncbi:hypothetical protein C942_01214 [Photobacterium marinum]|uniref:Uncharacterized protein n=1 Tax=Photobacterium marinum TaxID=1056511 RepID=L8JEL2_9GAMM|nr:hypothetical protein C942_01214 [Photobacterium marinum]
MFLYDYLTILSSLNEFALAKGITVVFLIPFAVFGFVF